MEQGAAGPAQRRPHVVPPPRDDAEPAPPAPSREDAAAEVQGLLAQLDDLRLVLSTDLGLAASAVDAGALEIARDVLAGAQDELAVFELRAARALHEPTEPGPLPVVPGPRRRWQRLSVLAPGLTAAAALVGVLLGVAPSTTPPAAPDASVATDAASSWDELRRLHEQGAPAERLGRAARQLHAEVARLVAAGASPEAVTEALRLLELQRRVLSDPEHADELGDELAESQRLVAALRRTVLGGPAGTVLADAPLRSAAPLPAAPAAGPTTTSKDPSRTSGDLAPAPAPAPAPTPTPAERPRPAAVAVPAPAPEQPAEPAQAPADAPAEQPAAKPSASPTPSPGTSPDASSGTATGDGGTAPGTSAPASPPPAPVLPPRTGGTLLPE